jgi:hypothetical protein
VDQSGDDTCQFLPRGIPRRLKFDVHQSTIDTCHMCHVAVRPTPVRPSPGVAGTHPPTTYPGVFGKFPGCSEVPRVFWKVRGSSGCFWEVPGIFGKFRVFLGSSPGVLGSSGTLSEVPRCFRKLPSFGTKKTRFVIIRLQKIQIKSKNS